MAVKVVFVCLGNICRSPMAEGVFKHLVKEAGLQDKIHVDSCGTGGWHIGEAPHVGTQKVLAKHGVDYQHQARQLHQVDFDEADYLIAMDSDNLRDIMRTGSSGAEVAKLLDFAKGIEEADVPDPYYTGRFDEVYELVLAGSKGLLAHIRQKEGI
jgi:protein-tyrosine phosphatase